MHEILWTGINVDIGLDSLGVSAMFRTRLILKSESSSHCEPHDLHSDWEPDVEDHCLNDCVTNTLEPISVEVRIRSTKYTKKWTLRLKVSVTKHEQETRVEELANENSVGCVFHLRGLSVNTNKSDDFDNDHSDDCVDDNDQILD